MRTSNDNKLETLLLPEWKKKTFPLKGNTLHADDRQLVTTLSNEKRFKCGIDELRDGLRITSRSWVGVVRFHEFELQIVPKLVGENLGLVELIDYAHGIDALEENSAVRTLEGSGTSLFDLIALLLAEACEDIARAGVLSDYCEVEDNLPVIRGRLLVVKQVLKRFTKIDRLECRYDEYLSDIPENQILLAALSNCANRIQHPRISMRVRRMLAIFSEVCSIKSIDSRLVRSTLVYNRMNEHYREGHELAWLILDCLGIDDLFAAGSHHCFAFLLDMNLLFQDFIARWLNQVLRGTEFRVIPQRRDQTILWDADLSRPYTSVIPDILIERQCAPGRYLPIDAKYKLYDERNISSSDIYQTFVYAFAYGEQQAVLPTSLVLYPASAFDGAQTRIHVRHSGGSTTSAQIRAVPIHIPSALDEARRRENGPVTQKLLGLIEEVFGSGTQLQSE
jgi:5-methylcytosine-specific restriction enzyme subunit McrC